ncbi:recombinase family protein [Zooshikella sp. RANM57]|uniref:recombinase family protein n=1 Tax=Zooshikella sp. RANM57 TaxID=3425863 RepID=UPI003D6FD63E
MYNGLFEDCMRVYGYLRASTNEQDASRAKNELEEFAARNNLAVAYWFIEHESGASLKRPELFRLIEIAQPGDILLVEQVDRISRLNSEDWQQLKQTITSKGIKVVSLDLPTSHQFMNSSDEFTERMLSALNGMMLDMLAAVARKDYEDRQRRQSQGVQRAKLEGKYKGRPQDKELQENIERLLTKGLSYSQIIRTVKCSRTTIAKVKKSLTC